jgi:hypothetical protein
VVVEGMVVDLAVEEALAVAEAAREDLADLAVAASEAVAAAVAGKLPAQAHHPGESFIVVLVAV